ncbi:hypothetical protein [Paraburkholderia sp. 32]|uniref:hypothetical protein n=1 Tax=Paraburkholderia sp. 32 TaxID=2991057 RepID=UPI003D255CE8
MDFMLSKTWKELGGVHARFADHQLTRNLLNLSDSTQQIYLGLPSFHQVRREYWDRRLKQRKAAQKDT